jgi:hypothetical protein
MSDRSNARTRSRIVREGIITFRTGGPKRDRPRWGIPFDTALRRIGLTVGLVVLAAGCQPKYWYQEGRTFDECKADYHDCWTELLQRTTLHHTSNYKDRFLKNCMQQKGYELVVEKDLPLDIKRGDPEVLSDVPWIHAYGVAGTLFAEPSLIPLDSVPAESTPLIHRGHD